MKDTTSKATFLSQPQTHVTINTVKKRIKIDKFQTALFLYTFFALFVELNAVAMDLPRRGSNSSSTMFKAAISEVEDEYEQTPLSALECANKAAEWNQKSLEKASKAASFDADIERGIHDHQRTINLYEGRCAHAPDAKKQVAKAKEYLATYKEMQAENKRNADAKAAEEARNSGENMAMFGQVLGALAPVQQFQASNPDLSKLAGIGKNQQRQTDNSTLGQALGVIDQVQQIKNGKTQVLGASQGQFNQDDHSTLGQVIGVIGQVQQIRSSLNKPPSSGNGSWPTVVTGIIGLPVEECHRQANASDLGSKLNSLPRNNTNLLSRGAIVNLNFLINTYSQCLPDPETQQHINEWQAQREQTLRTCKQISTIDNCMESPYTN